MKTLRRTYLPDNIQVDKDVYLCDHNISSELSAGLTDMTKVKKQLKKEERKFILVLVLSKSLRGKTDLHGKPYQPSTFIFTT